jgi:hypothetical protein
LRKYRGHQVLPNNIMEELEVQFDRHAEQ